MKKTKLYRNGEGYIDKKPGDAIRVFHLKILGKVVLVDENGDRW